MKIIIDLVHNLALLVALSILSVHIASRIKTNWLCILLQGLLAGSIAVIGMMQPFTFSKGLIFDGRSVILSITALFFGPVPAVIAAVMAAALRVSIGGVGMWVGLSVITASVSIGTVFHYSRAERHSLIGWKSLLLMGILTHIAMILLMFILPGSLSQTVIQEVGLPVMVIYTLATLLIGAIMSDRFRSMRYLEELQEKERFREEADRDNRARRIAEEASRAKSEFLAHMSHELRTPLNSIIALTGVLRRRLQDRIESEEKEYLAIIEKNGNILLDIFNDILDISRIDSGNEDLTLSQFQISDLLADMESRYRKRAESKKLSWHVEKRGRDMVIESDREKLDKVLRHITENAIKFTEAGSITFTSDCREKECIIEISDTGCGIPADKREEVFTDFQQGDRSKRKRFEGIGLGLSLARRYMRLLGGNIELATPPGGTGTLVRITIPARMETGVPGIPGKKNTVALIAEDNQDNRITLTVLLEEMGYTVFQAENGKVATEMARELKPDIIFMDIAMPVLDGIDALAIIRNTEEIRAVPVIAVSASAMKEDREQFSLLGFNDYIPKPIDREVLHSIAGKYHDQKKNSGH